MPYGQQAHWTLRFSMHPVFLAPGTPTVPVLFVTSDSWDEVRGRLDPAARAFADAAGFEPRAGRNLLLPAADGTLSAVLFGLDAPDAAARDPFLPGRLPGLLPKGAYRFAEGPPDARLAALAFALGAYQFARDLINTPANDMGPADLEGAARALAARHGASVRSILGDDLLEENFPLIHAVGRAADRAPRLIDLRWGEEAAPKVTLVGKGVCFDTGGLDIKPDSAMLLMKKDMAGAATVLALAHMIMGRGLKVRLRVLIPAVENAISGDAFRPRDVYRSRKGLTVEIGNTDAEGRLILADALAFPDEEEPELIVDMGTLTGAARVALGPDVPPFYTHDEELAGALARHAAQENDPLWRLPLWRAYDTMLDSKVADLGNVGSNNFE